MGGLKLQPCSPQRIEGIAADPEPDWSFEGLLSELNSLEKKLSAASTTPLYFPKSHPQRLGERKGSVLMRIDSELGVLGSDSDMEEEEEEGRGDLCSGPSWRFSCNELYLSDSDASDLESVAQDQLYLLDEADLVEDAIFELTNDSGQLIKEEVRHEISLLETKLVQEGQKWAHSSARIEKYVTARREVDKKLDVHYQRKIAEALDNHITALQRDHELKSQIEERKIRSDAAYEEAKRKEKAAQEERLRLERARAEAEEKARIEEAAKLSALAAEKKALEEAAEREAKEASEKLSAAASRQEAFGHKGDTRSEDASSRPQGSGLVGNKDSQKAVNVVRATESALSIEQERLQKLKKLEEDNDSLMLNSKMDFSSHQRHITRLIKQISGVQQNVIGKANEIIKILKNTSCPQTITIATFAKKVVANCESPNYVPFASAYVIVLVASQVPEVLDFVLAELHRACIYTIPKHIVYSESHFGSRDAYYKALGYREDDGKMENVQSYLNRLKSYMMLYGALVQIEETQGAYNSHGPKEGWAWLARFLNKLPANRYTAVALNAFLQAAGFVLFKKYNKNVNKPQFMKILNVIKDDFLKALIERRHSELNPIIIEIQSYIEDKKFLKEPEGRKLQGPLLSSVCRPESEPSMQPRTQYYY